jgi:Fur family ferric uptake transcriptional regulator
VAAEPKFDERDFRTAEEFFTTYLEGRGLVITPQRLAVLREAMSTGGHFEADELHHRLRAAGKSTSKATVYRTLELLVDSGVVRQVTLDERRSHYEAAVGRRHHDHLICIRCGRVIEFSSPELEDMQEKICRQHRFSALGHRMRIMGMCGNCSPRAGKR